MGAGWTRTAMGWGQPRWPNGRTGSWVPLNEASDARLRTGSDTSEAETCEETFGATPQSLVLGHEITVSPVSPLDAVAPGTEEELFDDMDLGSIGFRVLPWSQEGDI